MTEETKKSVESEPFTDDPTPESEVALTEDDLKAVEGIKERLKFFFSNANIRQDVFIRKLLTESSDKAVPVDVMMRFNTIKKLSEKPAVLIRAAKELRNLLLVDEEKGYLSRVEPFTEEMMKQNLALTLHLKDLPIKEEKEEDSDKVSKKYDVHVDELRALFDKYGEVALVKLQFGLPEDERRPRNSNKNHGKVPAGTALVEFHNEDDLKKAAEATLTIKDGEKVEPKEKVILPSTASRTDPVELKVMLLSEHLESKRRSKSHGKRDRDDAGLDEEPAKYTIDWTPGCVMRLKGLPGNCDREAILDVLAAGLGISVSGVKDRKIYADFSRGQKHGAIRFPEPSESIAELAKRLSAGELKIQDMKIEGAYVIEGEEEKKYWDDFVAFKNKQIARHREGRHKKHKHQRSR